VNEDILVMYSGKLADISGKKKREYLKDKSTSLKQRIRIRTSETCIGASMNLRRVTNVELTW
jgi:hypothetical protein